jgi:hypothetical protein
MSLRNHRVAAVAAGAAILVGFGSFGAVAAGLVTSAQIKNSTIQSVDIKNGQVEKADVGTGAVGSSEIADGSVQGRDLAANTLPTYSYDKKSGVLTITTGDKVQKLGLNGPSTAVWVANTDSQIVDGHTVKLSGGSTSVETSDLDMPVDAKDVVSFKASYDGTAVCASGAPRVFVMVDGKNVNSWDSNIDAGTQCGKDGVITFTLPAAGRISAAGVVYDNDKPGTVTVRDLTVDGVAIPFK